MNYEKIEQGYGIIFGRKKDSKDLRDTQTFKELYMSKISTVEDREDFIRKERELEKQGYETLGAKIKIFGNLGPDDTLKLKITKSYLKPSPEGAIGCDFEL